MLSHLSSLKCETCHLGKHHQSSLPKSSHSHQSEPFGAINVDTWDPSQTSSLKGFIYFVVLVDNLSQMT